MIRVYLSLRHTEGGRGARPTDGISPVFEARYKKKEEPLRLLFSLNNYCLKLRLAAYDSVLVNSISR
jgi:hypothetical protein